MSGTIKVLTVGAALGSLEALFSKVKAIDAKHGKFELLLCVGDFFGPEKDENSEVEKLLEGKLEVPIVTYIMQGEHPIPPKVIEKFEETGGELCPNVYLIGKAGVLTTTSGINIAVLGGMHDPQAFFSSADSLSSPHYTSHSIQTLLSHSALSNSSQIASTSAPTTLAEAKAAALAALTPALQGPSVDILLTHLWPPSITALSSKLPVPLPTAPSHPASGIDDIVRAARPRYLFSASPGENNQSIFWEREPFVWGEDDDNRVTRFVGLGAFGGPASSEPGAKKPRWFYAFSIAQASAASSQPRPANATASPFHVLQGGQRGMKRTPEEANMGTGNFLWGDAAGRGVGRNAGKRTKTADHTAPDRPPPPGYKCRICDSSEHYINVCPQRTNQENNGQRGPKKPPSGYICRACGNEDHYIKDCPNVASRRDGERRTKEIGPDECWFCLSNPRLTKHLIVSIGSECYLTLPKGQLPPTDASAVSPIPGGGHLLIIPISHYPTLLSVPAELGAAIISEIETYKSALRAMFAAHNNTGAVFFEVARLSGKGGHAHVQVVPVPARLRDQVEGAFRESGAREGIDWEPEPETALDMGRHQNYFRVDLPDGRKMMHLLKQGQPFNLQFGRATLAQLLSIPHRTDWKACSQTDEEEKRDVHAFKSAFASFDPSG
ncbi:hypothetical protein BOTBODRAFT_178064 [Botryobasidium botryosum FD-172 SS1]|uniref:CCHC-type domain-containing protein n=1 Tax=Botryobasidium botryosum (strain FD-172 SS1) TaxID=930990 RepID=A0A067M797_BOTB1|nr:hypothetical protein BOTBODRAFT_178064 [Botryobasidium botryosum FD-172 SS1]